MATARSTGDHSKSRSSNRDKGRLGEETALWYLRKKGYSIVELNYRCVFGEIDIIARDGYELVFVEVKSRTSSRFGDPESSVDLKKQKKLSRSALHYLECRGVSDCNARFDVLAVTNTPEGMDIRHIINAFESTFP